MNNRLALQFAISLAATALIIPISASGAHGKGSGQALLHAQLTQFNGGCPPNPIEARGGCIDVQFNVHRAPACTNGPNIQLDPTYSITMVRKFGDPAPLAGGSSTLVRANDGVALTLITTGLVRNAPYTVWWVGFNPDNPCIDEVTGTCTCTGDDLRPGLDSVFYATGGTTDRLGTGRFAAHVDYGELPDGIDQIPVFDTPSGPITFDAPLEPGAEIHNVIRAHGKALRGNGGQGSK